MIDDHRFAYLHGFGSSPLSRKGLYLADDFANHGATLLRPDLNLPSFSKLTFSGALEAIDTMDEAVDDARWRLIGSSMGGYLATRWTELNPERVDRLLLLCPGFDLMSRWPAIFGEQRIEQWERTGEIMVPGPDDSFVPLHWAFMEDARRHPPVPDVHCPVLIIHGTRDETVPVESSRAYAARRNNVELIEVDDDHSLMQSIDFIADQAREFFEID